MKKYLPKNSNTTGFTLIELLVVIAILAVLAVMGFAAFSGLTGRGNDDRRKVDVKAISDAIEVKKGTNSTYQAVTANDFAGGTVPVEPIRTGTNPQYCYTDGTAAISNPSVWTNTACPAAGAGNGTGWMVVGGATVPTVSATATYFKICVMDEAKAAVICQGSRQ